ncbi:DUF222 domain-containing protein [Mycolicibacterium sphagni]|uniref:DUF222 domain-containing protein n=1 Tax=Mycolicibacterium sphagni TaxID=1786 RepID=A0ABX2JQ73_9MYCO|nr:DUF222 domain-containing protein [Mycolicibacterium sphagni]
MCRGWRIGLPRKRLRVIADIFELRRRQRGEREDWAVDTWAAVGAEVAAAQRVSLGKANSYMNYAVAMLRLPAVAAVFEAGDIDFPLYKTIVFRTHLITDAEAMAGVDAELAAVVARWPSMSRRKLATEIDDVVIQRDPDAVRRIQERGKDCDVTFWENCDGHVEMTAVLSAADAELVKKRLTAMATSVCEADPRTAGQRRSAALGALGAGVDRLACTCGHADCPAPEKPTGSVVIHVVADQATLEGTAARPGYLLDTGELIPPELLAELKTTARQRPLVVPIEVPPDPSYHPSRALADFVRARDLTCRAPGCDKPATVCDIDHTIPWPYGATHAANLKCLCRDHQRSREVHLRRDRDSRRYLPAYICRSDGTPAWCVAPARGLREVVRGQGLDGSRVRRQRHVCQLGQAAACVRADARRCARRLDRCGCRVGSGSAASAPDRARGVHGVGRREAVGVGDGLR